MDYIIKQFPDKKFTNKMDQTRFIKGHFDEIKQIKMSEYKTNSHAILDGIVVKEFVPEIEPITSEFIQVKAVINTTNIIDSHRDMHMPQIWNKTVNDNPYSYHLKQHEAIFESVISKKAKNYNEPFNFNQLGLNVDFMTVANINEFVLQKKTMPFMFDKYVNGDVSQHSVGMIYVNMDMAYYDEESEKQMAFFEEMKKQAVNPDVADEFGYFWVIYEAKKREGSAVVFGSNSVTPTLSVKNYEPQKSTQKQIEPPLEGTQKSIDYKFLSQGIKQFKVN